MGSSASTHLNYGILAATIISESLQIMIEASFPVKSHVS